MSDEIVPQSLDLKVAQRLSMLMKASGKTAEQTAKEAGLHKSFIYRLMKGEKRASLDTLERLSRVLGIKVRELFPEE